MHKRFTFLVLAIIALMVFTSSTVAQRPTHQGLHWRWHFGQKHGAKIINKTKLLDMKWSFDQQHHTGTGKFLYSLDKKGNLYWYRHDGQGIPGSSKFTGPTCVSRKWKNYVHIMATGQYIYALDKAGNLYWHRHLGQSNGSDKWIGPRKVATNFKQFDHALQTLNYNDYRVVVSGKFIYGINKKMQVFEYRHDGQSAGTNRWFGPAKVKDNLFNRRIALSGNNFYAIGRGGELIWWRHDGQATCQDKWTGPKEVHGVDRNRIYLPMLILGEYIYEVRHIR